LIEIELESSGRPGDGKRCRPITGESEKWSEPTVPKRELRWVGRIVISESVTLDGVIQNPSGDEGFRLGGWAGCI
jgi:hypothetical protein